MAPVLLDTSFWDVVWWMVIVFFLTMAIWLFIAVFADIFRRRDLSGWGKAAWILGIFVVPFLGALLYLIFRPVMTAEDEMYGTYESSQPRASGYSAAEEIAKAERLRDSGAISAAEFDSIKRRVLA